VFLALNGVALRLDQAELYTLTMRVAVNEADGAEVATFLRGRLS